MSRRPLFLRWAVRQALVVTILLAAGVAYGHRLHGASLAMVPLILLVLAASTAYAGLLAWRSDEGDVCHTGLRHLWFTAGACQLLGLLGTVAGFYAMFNDSPSSGSTIGTADLAGRVTHGAGVALSATFVGILASLVILLEHHLLDHGEDQAIHVSLDARLKDTAEFAQHVLRHHARPDRHRGQ